MEASAESKSKGKAVSFAASPPRSEAVPLPLAKYKKGLAIGDFVLRLGTIGASMGAAALMGTNEQILPFFTQFLQFHAQWDQFRMFQFFVVANAAAAGYLILSLAFSIVCIVRPLVVAPRLLLVILDSVMMALVTAGASSAAAITYLIHNGSQDANWMEVCSQFTDFCAGASQAVVVSFIAVLSFLCLILVSSLALKRY
ncbi:casparian strip membrane protein 4 [Neltuma alba]|uniref:casparian strip membrane protein 4 n=1 Tax=Neltuma alba TaxID=207710 RepID=UPI0010A5751D|nr:casparian strip membrane protein 4-like [Prosopis alba]